YAAAEQYLDETDALYREVGSGFGLTRNRALRGELAFWAGDFQTARAAIKETLETLPDSMQTGKWDSLSILGMIACVEGDYRRGREIGGILPAGRYGYTYAENVLALAACSLGDDAEAARQTVTMLAYRFVFVNIARSSALPISVILLAHEG